MITSTQLQTLAKKFQIDDFTIMREYLQILFLSYLYTQNISKNIYFNGGTAIRLLLNSPRFSEDLDFSCTISKPQIKQLIVKLEKQLQAELLTIHIALLYSGKHGLRYQIKYQSPGFKYPFNLRLDFSIVKKILEPIHSPFITEFPIAIFPIISHPSFAEILAEKLCALSSRDKGRDYYDTWYLLEKGIIPDSKLLTQKFVENNLEFNHLKLIKKINSYSQKKLNLDLAQFLPKSQKKIIPMLFDVLQNKLGAVHYANP